jgi:putative transposase
LIYDIRKRKNTESFLEHLKHLRKIEKKKWIILILDNASIHKTKRVKDYCKKNNIRLVYLPPYSPELNYIEKVWKMIKKEFGKIYWKYEDIKR